MYYSCRLTLLLFQVVVGDQLTCKNIRAMKAWTQTEVEPKNRLQWAHEVPGRTNYIIIHAITTNMNFR